jgi:hypothetical protein
MTAWRQFGEWLRRRVRGRVLAEADLATAREAVDRLDYARAFALLGLPTRDRRLCRQAARLRVVLLERIGDLDGARRAADARCAAEPGDPGARADAIRLAAATGRPSAPAVLPDDVTRAHAPLFRVAAQQAMTEARHEDAVALATRSFALTGSANDAAQQLAMTIVAGDIAGAEAIAAEHAARFPHDPRFPVRLAQFAERRRDWPAMLAHHEVALARDSRQRIARSGKARALIYLERFRAAADWLGEARGDGDEGIWADAMAAFLHARRGDGAAAGSALDTVYAAGARHLAEDARGRRVEASDVWLADRRHVAHPAPFAAENGRHFARLLADLDAAGESILLGNSPALIGRGLGPEIDAGGTVIRLNDFTTRSFEADVGTRTDWWFSSAAKQARPDTAAVAGARALLIQPVAQHFPDPAAFVRGRLGHPALPRAVGYLPPWLHTLGDALPYPMKTMGFRSIMMLEFLIQRRYRALGFDFFASDRMHYFDGEETRLRVSEVHAIDFERDYVNEVLVPFGRYGRFA